MTDAALSGAPADGRVIVVEGPIGVGKTTLACRIAERLGGTTLLEAPEENPFLERFYARPEAYALPTQLFFLLQRAQQQGSLVQGDLFSPAVICDYLVDKDRLFAELNLAGDELELYLEMHDRVLGGAVRVPDLVIYLQAPVSVLKARIASRGIQYERGMAGEYLQQLVESYTDFFFHYNAAPLLIVNAADADFANREQDFEQLLSTALGIRRGRHYLNPLPFHD